MKRSVSMLLIATELGLVSWSLLGAQSETGLDALTYHRMTSAIVDHGLAPWTMSPLSYIGMYPGSDSSGIPFLAASFSLLSGVTIQAGVLVYDSVLIMVLGLGLFLLVQKFTGRTDLALLSIVMGSLAYGFLTTLSWSLDERSFNVALTPIFLVLALPWVTHAKSPRPLSSIVALALLSSVMLVSHWNFLLLLPFLFLVPLLYQVVYQRCAWRRTRSASFLYFGAIALSPFLMLIVLDQVGILGSYGLQYQLENSALFTGTSPLVFLANAFVFIGTRVGPINLACGLLALLFLATRPRLLTGNILVGGLLLTGFLGLPVITYSKDLLTPIFVVVGVGAIGVLTLAPAHHRTLAVIVASVVVLSGSVAFNTWNSSRTSRANDARFWAPMGVTPETQSGNLWIHYNDPNQGCAYGNNPVLLQRVTNEPAVPFCTGLAIDVLINEGPGSTNRPPTLQVTFVGINGPNPSDWFTSPELTQAANDFARLPSLSYQAGRTLLQQYNVSVVVVDLRHQTDIPSYDFQGTQLSPFFKQLWDNLYPAYESQEVAVFLLN